MALGRALANLGRASEGVTLIRNGVRALPETDRNGLTLFLSWLAEANALNCETSDALAAIERALEANVQERAWRGNAIGIRAVHRFNLGQNELAEADFHDAIASAQKIGAKHWNSRR